MSTSPLSYMSGLDLYYQRGSALAEGYPIGLGDQSPPIGSLGTIWESTNTWRTKQKYGERASSSASSAGSMDSRLSENFEAFSFCGNSPSSPPPMQVHATFDSSPFAASRPRELRRDSVEDLNDGRSVHARLPGPLNPRAAYFKMRTIIKGAYNDTVERSSSCASLSLDGRDIQAAEESANTSTTDAPKRKLDPGRQILSRMRVAVVKWQSRKQFFEFIAESERDNMHTWRRRRAVADALFSTGSTGEEWATLVARRFTKTTERQIAGLHAILRLRNEEELLTMLTCPTSTPRNDCSYLSYSLLNLVFLRFEPESFFRDVVSPVLRDWPADKPGAITWLARVISAFMPRVDAGVMSGYGRRVIQGAKPGTKSWLGGIWLLLALFLGQVAWTQNRTTILSVAKFILHVGMEALGKQTTDAGTIRTFDDVSGLKVLYSVVMTCLNCGGEDTLHSIVPSGLTLGPFREACIEALSANGSMTCSALKALALLMNVPTAMDDIPQSKMSTLATCCMDIVLGRGLWKKSLLTENCREDPFPLIPEEDAFDVLCRLPQPAFPKALAAALANCPVCLDPSSQDHLKLFDILEPLLWLSNMPSSVPEAHRALVDGDACEFLAKIILDSPQDTWLWQDRAIWRVKGEAITCLGNIIEKMDETELRSRLGEVVVKAIAEIRDNAEAPQAQRDQGTFTLIRYKAAAGRCGVVPFCLEKLVQDQESTTARE